MGSLNGHLSRRGFGWRKLAQELRTALKKLIEAKIIEMKASKGRITSFSVDIPGNITLRALNSIIKKYGKAQWKIVYNTSTKPYSTLEFS